MRRYLAAVCLLVLGCGRDPIVPTNTMLWRIQGGWEAPGPAMRQGVRVARGTILAFRAGNEYVEVHCSLIEQPDQTVLIQSGRPCASAVGRWEQKGDQILVHRAQATTKALCSQPGLTFEVIGNSVSGDVIGAGTASYSPVTRFVAPEFETHVNAAKRSDVRCAPLD